MSRKHLIILSLLVVAPLFAFFVVGWRLAEAEQARTLRQFESLLQANLVGIDGDIAYYFDRLERRLLRDEFNPDDPDSILAWARSEPLVEQVIVLDREGMPVYPDQNGPISQSENEYFWKIRQLINDRTLTRQRLGEQVVSQPVQTTAALGNRKIKVTIHRTKGVNAKDTRTTSPESGWFSWYWGDGLQLMHWRAIDNDRTLVIGLLRARWMADVIDMLPESSAELDGTEPAQIRLVDANGDIVYQWGTRELPEDEEPLSQLHLSSPLRPWQLLHFGPSKPFAINRSATRISLLGAGGLLTAGLLGLAFYLSREIGRQTREAQQRVSFVNQVSHELKTPLTNIRMYADLLEHDLDRIDPDDLRSQKHLSVITNESGRLSRLINNVLTFARTNRATSPPLQQGKVDEVIETVVGQFRPALERLNIEVTLDLDASELVELDVDGLEQMLGNLISNVEKYAADGRHLRIASRFRNGITTIDVSDAGPGISPQFAKRVFDPFERASDHIVAATGTGIGLGITRTIARRNGGDLILRESAIGASFRLTLATPICES